MSEAYNEKYVVTDEDVAEEFIHFGTSPLGYLTPAQKAIVVMKLMTKRHLSTGEVEIRTGITKPDRYYTKGMIVRSTCRKCGIPCEYIEYLPKDKEVEEGGYWKHSRFAIVAQGHDAEPAFGGGS